MERGLYAAATGMIAQQSMQDILAQNIANANTVGFKQDKSSFRSVQGMVLSRLNNGAGSGPEIGELGAGVQQDRAYTDWQVGPLTQTGKQLDASLGDNLFFAIQTRNGERYTRAGDFQLDGNGNLTNPLGQSVIGVDNQPINVPPALRGRSDLSLDRAGNLSANGRPVARLKIVRADGNQLAKEGDTLFRAVNPAAVQIEPRPTVRPGTLEQSNHNAVMGMVRLITVSRSFEMAHRALTTQDELLRQAASEVGKV